MSNSIDSILSRLKLKLDVDTDAQLAEKMGILPSDFSRRKKRGTLKPVILDCAINQAIDLNWLFIDDMTTQTSSLTTSEKTFAGQSLDPEAFTLVPMTEAHLSAGGGALVPSEEVKNYYVFRKDWLKQIASSLKDTILMKVEGDSMEGTIKDHDVVLIDMGRKRIQGGRIYALGIDDTIMVKRIEPIAGGKCRIISDNKEVYPAYEADLQDIRIIGQVIWFARELICK